MTRLVLPFQPTEVLNDLAAYKAANPESLIENVHFFPLGEGIQDQCFMGHRKRRVGHPTRRQHLT